MMNTQTYHHNLALGLSACCCLQQRNVYYGTSFLCVILENQNQQTIVEIMYVSCNMSKCNVTFCIGTH